VAVIQEWAESLPRTCQLHNSGERFCPRVSVPDAIVTRGQRTQSRIKLSLTPRDIALADPTMQERIANFSYAILPGSPAEFGKFIGEETEKWGEVVQAANMKPD